MEDVAKLVEEGDDLRVTQERGLRFCRLREVGDDGADWLLVRAVHQSATTKQREGGGMTELVRPREEVHVEVRDLAIIDGVATR